MKVIDISKPVKLVVMDGVEVEFHREAVRRLPRFGESAEFVYYEPGEAVLTVKPKVS